MNYKTEEKFIDLVEKCLKESGCKTWREVIPDNCENWTNPYRVDLIFYRDDFGYIGAEGKNINTLGQGGIISNAIDQIQDKYRNQTYFKGNIISRWCLLVPTESSWISEEAMKIIKTFLINFLRKRYNISLMEYCPYGKSWNDRIAIDRNAKNSLYIDRKYIKNKKEMTLFGGKINGN
jgi:hypothetical protein